MYDSIYFCCNAKAINYGYDSINCIVITRYLKTYYFKQLHAIYLTILLSANLRKSLPCRGSKFGETKVSPVSFILNHFLLYITIDSRFS